MATTFCRQMCLEFGDVSPCEREKRRSARGKATLPPLYATPAALARLGAPTMFRSVVGLSCAWPDSSCAHQAPSTVPLETLLLSFYATSKSAPLFCFSSLGAGSCVLEIVGVRIKPHQCQYFSEDPRRSGLPGQDWPRPPSKS